MSLRERKKLEAWRAIRAAALHLFDAHGYEAVSVEQIAAAANVSRATFFNYFASKEAVVFDQDPEERADWQALMETRPTDEPLWASLTAIMIGFNERLADRMPLQRRLKANSPALAQSSQDLSEQFRGDLRRWAASRTRLGEELTTALQLNLASAAVSTAYHAWQPDEPFDTYLRHVRDCLNRAATGFGSAPPDPS
ncbi:TetR family transcriptional regulator [Actinocorallia herbida]|uniref:TetR family transcriptional regulator n=1 Tax=Actinocorallia herbida TaxID=58109 RepID=A0A3N1D2W1_9ACTN|nr:TetR/AcrR family transcriptional regulator [Actinocorallia herbida]ROO87874.1 TetR family transcriptional regulator [Actinocorallia herbida]